MFRVGRSGPQGFLRRLARNTAGNTLAIMAAAMIPMIGFAGSAVDMARLYVVKVRLQQACDAGVLAGRKTMTDTSMSTGLDSTATTQAQAFFRNNFQDGWFRNTSSSFTPVKAATGTDATVSNAVNGTATATVPMALMSYFGLKPVVLNVSCQAVYDMADSDVMFVLDTTGSMSCKPSDSSNCANSVTSYTRSDGTTGYYNQESSGSKIDALRQAVILFDSTIRSNADPSSHFRYGFVTYSSAVNVGTNYDASKGTASLNAALTPYLQNTSWTYQSRHLSPAIGPGGVLPGDYAYGSTFQQTISNIPQSYCPTGGTIRLPTTGFVRSYDGVWSDEGYYQAREYTNIKYQNGACSGTGQRLRPYWRYEPVSFDISKYVTGATVTNPSRLDGATSSWRGCIEEVDTKTGSSFSVSSYPDDLNPDLKPTSSTDMWRPMWADVEWLRDSTGSQDVQDDAITEDSTRHSYNLNYRATGLLDQTGSAACGMPAARLQTWTAQQVHDYVYNADFKPFGGTYHDVGMIWGARMLSPDGVFAADTAKWSGRPDPSRSIVFMTDGTMSPSQLSYGQYGVEALDNRTGGAGSTTTDYNDHTNRFRTECDIAKKKGITIYVVALGTSLTSDLTYCASPGQTFQASSTDQLTAAFKTIAQRVSMLRINS